MILFKLLSTSLGVNTVEAFQSRDLAISLERDRLIAAHLATNPIESLPVIPLDFGVLRQEVAARMALIPAGSTLPYDVAEMQRLTLRLQNFNQLEALTTPQGYTVCLTLGWHENATIKVPQKQNFSQLDTIILRDSGGRHVTIRLNSSVQSQMQAVAVQEAVIAAPLLPPPPPVFDPSPSTSPEVLIRELGDVLPQQRVFNPPPPSGLMEGSSFMGSPTSPLRHLGPSSLRHSDRPPNRQVAFTEPSRHWRVTSESSGGEEEEPSTPRQGRRRVLVLQSAPGQDRLVPSDSEDEEQSHSPRTLQRSALLSAIRGGTVALEPTGGVNGSPAKKDKTHYLRQNGDVASILSRRVSVNPASDAEDGSSSGSDSDSDEWPD